jgi:ribosome-associated translation inhibitor RaiA
LQIQINTDNQIEGGTELTLDVKAVVEDALGRFHERITRVEVFLSDKNSSQKSDGIDMRCVMEARLSGMRPIVVTADGSSLEQALHGAANKLEKTLKRTLGRLDSPKGRMSYAGDQS